MDFIVCCVEPGLQTKGARYCIDPVGEPLADAARSERGFPGTLKVTEMKVVSKENFAVPQHGNVSPPAQVILLRKCPHAAFTLKVVYDYQQPQTISERLEPYTFLQIMLVATRHKALPGYMHAGTDRTGP